MTIPFMAMSDAPTITTGLARITRELLKHMRNDAEITSVFRIASLGLGQRSYISKPYPQYPASMYNFQVPELLDAWKDFSQGEDGVVFTIWNPSWLFWFPPMKKPFTHWAYLPIDAEGPNGKLPAGQMTIINSFDRKLAYSEWCGKMIDTPWLPHGIDTAVYRPVEAPKMDGLTIGICATNTRRKDWGLAAETCAILKKRGHKLNICIKTNTETADWHIPQLFTDFGLLEECIIDTQHLQEDEMVRWYNICDVTLAIGSGEGFGYPIAESLACGVPCIHGNYSGGAELGATLVDPVGYRWEGYCTDKRPIYDAMDWALGVEGQIGSHPVLPPQFDWDNLWPRWREWLLRGAR